MLKYLIFRVAALLLPWLPWRLGYFLADLGGEVAYYLDWPPKRHVLANLGRVLGPQASDWRTRAVTRSIFRTGARNHYDLFRLRRLNLPKLDSQVSVRGGEHLVAALAAGRGVIAVCPHLGSFDLVSQAAMIRNLPVTIAVERLPTPKLFQLVTRLRASRGLNLVPADNGALKALYRALKANHIVVIAADRDVQKNGLVTCFFGEETTLPSAPAIIALRTGAPLLPVYCIRGSKGTIIVHWEPPLPLQTSGQLKQDIQVNTQRVTAILEEFIRSHPEQWAVFEPVWKD